MELNYMTLDGRVDKEAFLEEWAGSQQRKATYLQTLEAVYVMPYGVFKDFVPDEEKDIKFRGSYRRHTFVKRDFEIKDRVLGGGYLILSDDKASCTAGADSTDFGPVPDWKVILEKVNSELLGR